jgi:sugar phosphate isomerase/epimerase
MKIGILEDCLGHPWTTAFAEAAAVGFDGVELGVKGDYAETELWSGEGREALARRAREASAEIASLCLHSFWQFSFANPDETVRATAQTITTSAIRFAAELGVSAILVPVTPGPDVEAAEGTRRWIEEMKKCAPMAEEHQVRLGLENVGRGYGKSAAELCHLADSVGSRGVGVYYDVGNATAFGNDPVEEIHQLGERIVQVHVKDWGGGPLLGEGRVQLAESIAVLRDIGYDGYLVLETPATDHPRQAATHNLAFVRGLLPG